MGQKIIAAAIAQRREEAEALQKVLTLHGCKIKARLGLHEAGNVCSDEGLIILQLVPGETEAEAFLDDLNKLDGIRAKLIEL